MSSADALIAPHSPACSPLIFALGTLYLCLEFCCLCRGKWPRPWRSLSQLRAVGFNSWKTRCSLLSWSFGGSFPGLCWLHVRSRERLSLCCVSIHGRVDPCCWEHHLLLGGEMLFSSHLPASYESRLGFFWLCSDPSCEQRTRPCGISPSEDFYEAKGSWSEGLWLPVVRGGRFGLCVSAQCPATMALSQCPELGEPCEPLFCWNLGL